MKFLCLVLVSLAISTSVFSQTTYIWTGSVNSNFSTAGNWTPTRQIGLTSDILVFETGTNLNVINVNQVTVGQLIIRDNTHLTLSPSTGNSKTIFINGSAGDDFVIESGSSLTIYSNDPQLNINVKAGATASISGILTFTGNANNNLTAIDSISIRFHQGSVLNQVCPGNIFTSAGIQNAVVFENGSTFRLNHINALNPFGLNAPASKVKFESGSTFDYYITNSGALSLSGRTYSNLILENGVNVTDNEFFNASSTIEDLTISNNSSLDIANLNTSHVADINLKGNLTVDGYVSFSDTVANQKNLALNFCGNNPQLISGAGIISFSDLQVIRILNGISLFRNLTVNCPASINAPINRNGYIFNFTLGSRSTTMPGKKNFITGNNTMDSQTGNLQTPHSFSISQNYPNPFNPSTKVDYSLPVDSKVSIRIFDINGREVAVIVDAKQSAGNYTASFDGSNLSSGAYFCRIEAQGNGRSFNDTKKMILTK